jgi:cytochrome b561
MMGYDRLTRWLHVGFVLGVPLQLLSENFMKHPKLVDGVPRVRTAAEANFFEMHEFVGMTVLTVVVLHILWSASRSGGGLGRLFPYFRAGGFSELIAEIKRVPGWFSGRLHETAEDSVLAGAVHGLGLLLILAMGATGATIFFGMDEVTGQMSGFVHDMKELHEGLGSLVWIYLIGHVGMAALHKMKGHDLLSRISPIAK